MEVRSYKTILYLNNSVIHMDTEINLIEYIHTFNKDKERKPFKNSFLVFLLNSLTFIHFRSPELFHPRHSYVYSQS